MTLKVFPLESGCCSWIRVYFTDNNWLFGDITNKEA
jgi:hypothetical protein